MGAILISLHEGCRDCGYGRDCLQVIKGRFRVWQCNPSCDDCSLGLSSIGEGACDRGLARRRRGNRLRWRIALAYAREGGGGRGCKGLDVGR